MCVNISSINEFSLISLITFRTYIVFNTLRRPVVTTVAVSTHTLCILPQSLSTCFILSSQQIPIVPLHIIIWLVPVQEAERVCCAVRSVCSEWTSSTARLLKRENVFNDDVSSEGNYNEQSANSYFWKNVAVYFKVTYQHSPRVDEENPEDYITKGTPIKIGQKNNRTSRKD